MELSFYLYCLRLQVYCENRGAQSKRWLLFLPRRWEFHDRLTIAPQLMRSGYNVAVKLDRSQ